VARVLLIDDDIAEISAVKRVLSRGGHQAILATSVADALSLAEQERPEVAVVSAACENGSGAALAHRFLAEGGASLPVLVLGEAGDVPDGAVRIPRPLDPSQLAEELRLALGHGRGAPIARIPLTALSGGSPGAATDAAEARASAAERLRQRADELRRERAAADRWLEPPETPPGAAAAGPPGATEHDLPPAPAGPESLRQTAEDELVAEIDAELDRLTRDDPDEERIGPGPGMTVEEAADEIARRAEDEADRRRVEAARGSGPLAQAGREGQPGEFPRPEPAAPAEAPAPEEPADDTAGAEVEARRQALAESLRQAEEARRRTELELAADAEARRLAEDLARERAQALHEGDGGRRAAAAGPAPAQAEEGARRRAHELAGARRAEPAAVPEPLAPPRPLPGSGEPCPPAAGETPPPGEPELPPPPAELAAGTLAEAPMPRLLALAARAALTGRLDFGSAAPRSVYFEEGRVVGATSASPQERVEDVALRLGLLTRDQHRQAAPAAAGLSSRRTALLLLERGFMKPEELTALVRRRAEEVVFALFAEVAAPFRYSAARVPPEERIALARGPLALALDGVRRKWVEPRLGAVLGGPSTLLAPAPRAPRPAELGLSPPEERAAALADGLRTLDEIQAGSPLDPLATSQLLAGLVMVGALASRFQAGGARESGARAIDLGRLREKLDQVRRADYFTILGLSRHATPFEVREAAARLLAEFDPGRFLGLREPGLREKLDEVRRVVAEALDVLGDEVLRAEYVDGLGGG